MLLVPFLASLAVASACVVVALSALAPRLRRWRWTQLERRTLAAFSLLPLAAKRRVVLQALGLCELPHLPPAELAALLSEALTRRWRAMRRDPAQSWDLVLAQADIAVLLAPGAASF